MKIKQFFLLTGPSKGAIFAQAQFLVATSHKIIKHTVRTSMKFSLYETTLDFFRSKTLTKQSKTIFFTAPLHTQGRKRLHALTAGLEPATQTAFMLQSAPHYHSAITPTEYQLSFFQSFIWWGCLQMILTSLKSLVHAHQIGVGPK